MSLQFVWALSNAWERRLQNKEVMCVWSNSSSGMCVWDSCTALILCLDLVLRSAAIPLKVILDFCSFFSQQTDFTGNSGLSNICFPDLLVLHGAIGGPDKGGCSSELHLSSVSSNRTPLSRESGTCCSTPLWLSAAPWPNEWDEVNSVSQSRSVCVYNKKPQSSGGMMMLWHRDMDYRATCLKPWSKSCGCVSPILNMSVLTALGFGLRRWHLLSYPDLAKLILYFLPPTLSLFEGKTSPLGTVKATPVVRWG